jgi:transposase
MDVSKDSLDVCLLRSTDKPRHQTFENESAGHQKLLRWVKQLAAKQVCHFALEATGAYGQAIAAFLADAEQRVSILNPARVKYGGIASGQGNKTDKADALGIAHYCRLHSPPLWREATPEVRELRALVRRLADVQSLLSREKNRASVPGILPAVRLSLERSLTFLDDEIRQLQQQIKKLIHGCATLKADQELLTSIPGIGEVTAQTLLSELPDVEQFGSAEQVAAWAGLCPREHRSGTSVRKRTRLSKAGNAHVRKALYFPAITAVRHNPLVEALYQRLRAAGKSQLSALGAAMRKLLMLCYGVLKNRQKFTAEWKKQVATVT